MTVVPHLYFAARRGAKFRAPSHAGRQAQPDQTAEETRTCSYHGSAGVESRARLHPSLNHKTSWLHVAANGVCFQSAG